MRCAYLGSCGTADVSLRVPVCLQNYMSVSQSCSLHRAKYVLGHKTSGLAVRRGYSCGVCVLFARLCALSQQSVMVMNTSLGV